MPSLGTGAIAELLPGHPCLVQNEDELLEVHHEDELLEELLPGKPWLGTAVIPELLPGKPWLLQDEEELLEVQHPAVPFKSPLAACKLSPDSSACLFFSMTSMASLCACSSFEIGPEIVKDLSLFSLALTAAVH